MFNESIVLTNKLTIFENKIYIHGRVFSLVCTCIFKTHNKEEITHINFASIYFGFLSRVDNPLSYLVPCTQTYEHATR